MGITGDDKVTLLNDISATFRVILVIVNIPKRSINNKGCFSEMLSSWGFEPLFVCLFVRFVVPN